MKRKILHDKITIRRQNNGTGEWPSEKARDRTPVFPVCIYGSDFRHNAFCQYSELHANCQNPY
jgi:hypothetical protein